MTEVAILIGLQASGKTTFYHQVLAATHEHISKDAWPNAKRRQHRQMRLISAALEAGHDIAIDNTNPSAEEWAPIIAAARAHGALVVGYWFPPDVALSQARNALRDGKTRVPDVGFYATLRILRQPSPADGFDAVMVVRADGEGGFDIRQLEQE